MMVCGKDVVLARVWDLSTPALPQKTVPMSVLMNGARGLTPERNTGFHPKKIFFPRDPRDVPPLNLADTCMPVHPG